MANGRLVMDPVKLQKTGAELMNVIESSKENFYINLGKKFKNPSACNKMYQSVLKTFNYNKKPYYSIIIGQQQEPNF